jgi:hypothetical protein
VQPVVENRPRREKQPHGYLSLSQLCLYDDLGTAWNKSRARMFLADLFCFKKLVSRGGFPVHTLMKVKYVRTLFFLLRNASQPARRPIRCYPSGLRMLFSRALSSGLSDSRLFSKSNGFAEEILEMITLGEMAPDIWVSPVPEQVNRPSNVCLRFPRFLRCFFRS